MSDKQSSKRTWVLVLTAAALAVGAGVGYRHYKFTQAQRQSLDNALRQVTVIQPSHGDKPAQITFPGKLEGFSSATIYSRVNGYLKSWSKDIGSRVKAGDALGMVESPEVDQQYEQANSDVLAAKSNERLAEVSLKRWENLVAEDAVSQQELDQRRAELASKQALRQIAESNLERARKFLSYKSLKAPFDGIVTERNTDIGVLVSNGGGRPLFVVTNIDQLRLFIQLPQIYLHDIRPGVAVSISVPEYPDQEFKAEVVRSSGAVNDTSGTSLVEVAINNKDHRFTSGEYARVRFSLPFDKALLRIPASALIIRKDGTYVAEVNEHAVVSFKRIKVSRDFGQEIEIVGDVTEHSNIIGTPADTLVEGEKVVIYSPAAAGQHKEE